MKSEFPKQRRAEISKNYVIAFPWISKRDLSINQSIRSDLILLMKLVQTLGVVLLATIFNAYIKSSSSFSSNFEFGKRLIQRRDIQKMSAMTNGETTFAVGRLKDDVALEQYFQESGAKGGAILIGFGSLMSKTSSSGTFPNLKNFQVVRVDGYRRCVSYIVLLLSNSTLT